MVIKIGIGQKTFSYLVLMLAFIVIVIPNAIRVVSLPLIFFSAFLALIYTRWTANNINIFLIWVASAFVTIFFVFLGYLKDYSGAVEQIIFVYMISPALWLLICSKVLDLHRVFSVIKVSLLFGIFGGISVFIFYYIFLKFGSGPLIWLIAEPNIEYGDGTARANMHVFGTLMFVSSGFIAAPQIIENRLIRIIAGFVFFIAALLSGRSALILSLAIGLLLFITANFSLINILNKKRIITVLFFIFFSIIILFVLGRYYEMDVFKVFANLIEKISEGGGEARVDQADALIKGILDSSLLGAGHGVGVSVIRNEEYPWRYELLWLATLFRVGIFGSIIYLIPVGVIFFRYFRQLILRKNTYASDFMFSGFIASFIGAATNPYYESFEFQWMLVLPFIYFMRCKDATKKRHLDL